MTGTTIDTTGLVKVSVNDVLKGDEVVLITGSQKTRNLAFVKGVVVDFAIVHINAKYCYLQAIVKDENGVLHTDSRTYIPEAPAEMEDVDVENDSPIPTIDELYPHHDDHALLMENEFETYIRTYRMQMSQGERIEWQKDFGRRKNVMNARRAARVNEYLSFVSILSNEANETNKPAEKGE